MEFSALLTLAVWTASIAYLTSGKGELQTANNFLSLSSYFSACYLIPITLYYLFIYIYVYIGSLQVDFRVEQCSIRTYICIYIFFFFFFGLVRNT